MSFKSSSNRANWDRLNEAEKHINSILEDCDLAERCRIDVIGRRHAIEGIREQIQLFRTELFPSGEPTI